MAKSKNLPDYVIPVATYDTLRKYAQAFAEGHLNLLFLGGPPGAGKSREIRAAVGGDACWIDGTATPFRIYGLAYEFRNQPIVLDDVDGLYRDGNGIRLLKSLCQTERVKTVAWQTSAAALDREGIPRQFTTNSRVVIIANEWKSLNANVTALEDRGHILHFDPSAVEIHRQAGTWFWNQEIFDFVAAHLHLLERPSLRIYQLAWEQMAAGLDWKSLVLSRCLRGTALEVAKLKADPTFGSEEERVQAFVAAGMGCRATYFNHAKRLQTANPVPPIVLSQTAPPSAENSPFDLIESLLQRFGRLGNG